MPTDVSHLDQLPQNREAEQALLGALMIDPGLVPGIAARLRHEDFFSVPNGWVYEAIAGLSDRGREIDYITVFDELRRLKQEHEEKPARQRGLREFVEIPLEYLAELTERTPTTANTQWYAAQVRTRAILREFIHTTGELQADAYGFAGDLSEFMDEAEKKVFAITQRDVGRSAPKSMLSVLGEVFEKLDAAKGEHGFATGLLTPFAEYNQLTGGIHRGELTVIAARPSMGKTSLALALALHFGIVEEIPGLFFSREMKRTQIGTNMLCIDARIDSKRLRTGYVDEYEYDRLATAAGRIKAAPIFLDDSEPMTTRNIAAATRRAKKEHDIQWIAVDYLQMLDQPAGRRFDTREQEVGRDSRALKSLARELDIAVICLAQLNRDVEKRAGNRGNFRPRMSDLRESGSIEQDADAIVLLHRNHYYTHDEADLGKAELILAKQRNGPTGTADIGFLQKYMRFTDDAPTYEAYPDQAAPPPGPPPPPEIRQGGLWPAAPPTAPEESPFDYGGGPPV